MIVPSFTNADGQPPPTRTTVPEQTFDRGVGVVNFCTNAGYMDLPIRFMGMVGGSQIFFIPQISRNYQKTDKSLRLSAMGEHTSSGTYREILDTE